MDEKENTPLDYFISSTGNVFVVVFAGSFHRESIRVLEECQKKLLAQSPKFVILVFRDVATRVELPAFPAIAKFEKAIRDFPAAIRICSLHPELKNMMEAKGLIRPSELDNNINESLKQIRRLPK